MVALVRMDLWTRFGVLSMLSRAAAALSYEREHPCMEARILRRLSLSFACGTSVCVASAKSVVLLSISSRSFDGSVFFNGEYL